MANFGGYMQKNEVGYIDSWPRRIPYPGREYGEEVLDLLEECYNVFKNKKYRIEFSNDKTIDVYVWTKNICHLLGIDYLNLAGSYFDEYRKKTLGLSEKFNAVDLVDAIVENRDKVLTFDYNRGNMCPINYYKIEAKCLAYKAFKDLSEFSYGCIDFNKDEYNKREDRKFTGEAPKYLYSKSDSEVFPFFLLGIRKSNERDRVPKGSYFADTTIASYSPESFFAGQEIILPYRVTTNNGSKEISREELLKLLIEYRNTIEEYNIQNKMRISKQKLLKLQ